MLSSVAKPVAAWPSRWLLYLREMFQPGSRLIFSLLSSLGLGWSVLALQGYSLRLDLRLLLATASLMLVLLYYRLCDEFKDLETDLLYFPERPVPSGKVLVSDLRTMQISATILGFALNLLWPLAPVPYAALWIFAWLMGKWFFLPKLIGNNRLLAFVTHSPISVFGSFYVIALYLAPGKALLALPHWMLAIWFALPGCAWEVARKTRAPENEAAGYQIYSTLLGHRGAALLPPLFTLINLAVGVWLHASLALPLWFLILLGLASLAYIVPFGLFVMDPLGREAWLKPASEAYTGLLLVLLPLALGLSHPVLWSF